MTTTIDPVAAAHLQELHEGVHDTAVEMSKAVLNQGLTAAHGGDTLHADRAAIVAITDYTLAVEDFVASVGRELGIEFQSFGTDSERERLQALNERSRASLQGTPQEDFR